MSILNSTWRFFLWSLITIDHRMYWLIELNCYLMSGVFFLNSFIHHASQFESKNIRKHEQFPSAFSAPFSNCSLFAKVSTILIMPAVNSIKYDQFVTQTIKSIACIMCIALNEKIPLFLYFFLMISKCKKMEFIRLFHRIRRSMKKIQNFPTHFYFIRSVHIPDIDISNETATSENCVWNIMQYVIESVQWKIIISH